jgi:hypothetical protein
MSHRPYTLANLNTPIYANNFPPILRQTIIHFLFQHIPPSDYCFRFIIFVQYIAMLVLTSNKTPMSNPHFFFGIMSFILFALLILLAVVLARYERGYDVTAHPGMQDGDPSRVVDSYGTFTQLINGDEDTWVDDSTWQQDAGATFV